MHFRLSVVLFLTFLAFMTFAIPDYEICPADTGKLETRCLKDEDCDQGGKMKQFCGAATETTKGYCCQPIDWRPPQEAE